MVEPTAFLRRFEAACNTVSPQDRFAEHSVDIVSPGCVCCQAVNNTCAFSEGFDATVNATESVNHCFTGPFFSVFFLHFVGFH